MKRRHTNESVEKQAKIALVTESYALGNFRNGTLGGGEKLLGFRDPKIIQIRDEGLASDSLEKAGEVSPAHPHGFRCVS
jgi:hypothetical protein